MAAFSGALRLSRSRYGAGGVEEAVCGALVLDGFSCAVTDGEGACRCAADERLEAYGAIRM